MIDGHPAIEQPKQIEDNYQEWFHNNLNNVLNGSYQTIVDYTNTHNIEEILVKLILLFTTLGATRRAARSIKSFTIQHIPKLIYLIRLVSDKLRNTLRRETDIKIAENIDPLKDRIECLEKELTTRILKTLEKNGYTTFTPYIQSTDRMISDLRQEQRNLENKLNNFLDFTKFRMDAFIGGRLHDINIQQINQQAENVHKTTSVIAANVRSENIRNKFRN
ncbi:NSP4 [Rotavirus I]|uniref:NSP4 n=1 Tax=Rotavirus I TaxID=1637496 RepID=A0A0E3M2B6_9REOV|nr:NSP4 [Rotavirus I]AKA63271.1 NSP4 [Rotavirus I]